MLMTSCPSHPVNVRDHPSSARLSVLWFGQEEQSAKAAEQAKVAAQQEATAGEQAAAAAELEAREADLGTQGAALESSAGQLGSQEATLTQRQACLLLCSAPPGPVSVYFARICDATACVPSCVPGFDTALPPPATGCASFESLDCSSALDPQTRAQGRMSWHSRCPLRE